MNQRPMENKPLSSSKPPAYIPPVKRPGQIPPLQQPPVQPLQKQILAENESPLQKSGPQNMSEPSNRFQCIHTPNRSTGLPTGVCLRPRNCSSGEANRARRCRGWFQNFFCAKGFTGDSAWILPANSPQTKGGLSISRQTQPLFQGLSRCSVLLFVLLSFQ